MNTLMNIRNYFPIVAHHKELIFFDNAASTQKPQIVIDAITQFYAQHYAPIKRGIYTLAEQATEHYEHARKKVAQFINAEAEEIVFTSNATESINFIAATWARKHIQKNDQIVITQLEHHSNMLPWQRLCQEVGAQLVYIPVDAQGNLIVSDLERIITKKTKLVAFLDVSNAIGTHVPVDTIVRAAKKVGAKILIDACQSVPHKPLDVKTYECDFLVFSGHKLLGPTGIGVLYIKKELHNEVPPYQVGGGMVFEVGSQPRWLKPPHCYEAGTPPFVQAIGLAAAIDFLQNEIDFNNVAAHEAALCAQLIDGLQSIKHIRIIGPVEQLKTSGHLVSFVHEKHHFHDIAAYLDKRTICVRAGHYCAQPLAQALGIDGSVRVSFYCYNTAAEVDTLIKALKNLS